MGRRLVAVVAAMVIGLIGVAAVLFYARGADSRAIAGQRVQTVFVAQQLVPSGTSASDAVAKGLMVPTVIAVKGIPAGALTTVNAANGNLVALTDIPAGSFVVASGFGTTPTGQRAIQVPDGEVAISVSFADPARVGTFLTPGSRIVIYDTYSPPVTTAAAANAGAKATRVLLDNVLVIAVGTTSLTPSAAGGAQAPAASGSLVTVALPPDTAPILVHGIQTGTLYAALQGTDTKTNPSQVVSDSTLFDH